ncbi:Kinesin-related protein 11 [Glycine soja]|uniref:Kinesin-related protein 11 n=1 Tax=Glycine soja TaxID=3848 RepID=A0A0B2SKK3_GLYSO|nr:Kinesin-related protein 11 [Glycine soja]
MSGITDFAIADIFNYIEKRTEREFVLKFSALEIYNESVRDLLSVDGTPLRLLDDPKVNIFISVFQKAGASKFYLTVCNLNKKGQLSRDSQRKL